MRDLRGAHHLFNGHRLALARRLRGLTRQDLATRIGVTAAAISQHESGATRPRQETLAALCIALRVPPGFFAHRGTARLVEDDWHFRSLRATRKRDRDRVLALTTLLIDLVTYAERFVELPDIDMPANAKSDLGPGDVESAAAQLRETWDVGDGPISNMVQLLEVHGCVLARMEGAVREVDAFSGHAGARPYVILMRDKQDAARSRFDAAHELGHLVLHSDVSPGSVLAEREANQFASSFLLPRETVSDELPPGPDWATLLDLKARWGVSLAALLYRSREIGRMSETVYRRAVTEMSANGWRRREPGEAGAIERPRVVLDALNLVASVRGITLEDVLAETDIPSADVEELLEANVGPRKAERLSPIATIAPNPGTVS